MALQGLSDYWAGKPQPPKEECHRCGAYTGRAGRGDDSIYCDHEGPWCEECIKTHRETACGRDC